MRIAILGEERWSHRFVQKVLEVGYEAALLTPHPESVMIKHPLLTIIPGTADDMAAVEQALWRASAVVGLLAQHSKVRSQHIVSAMRLHDVRRGVFFTEQGEGLPDPQHQRKLLGFLSRRGNQSDSADVICTSGRDWTLICPRDQARTHVINEHVDISDTTIQKVEENFANFLLRQITDATYVAKHVTI